MDLGSDFTIDDDEIIVDLFAGGGGASTGIEAALRRHVDIAVNHSPNAIKMHRKNHPRTKHYRADVWHVSPREACRGRRVALLWLSPACTHFSRASGGQNPKSAKIRSLASVAIRWAREVKPRVIFLENVEEFLDWGPLDNEGRPIKSKKGRSFRNWLGKLKAQGYVVEWRKLVAADYGAPTARKRLFLIARCDGQPIVWPEPTHGPGRARPWRSAAECIDWSVNCPSIFLSKEEGRRLRVKRPLVDATLRRIAAGVIRFVMQNPKPFIVKFHAGDERNLERNHSIDEPLRTVDTSNRFAVVSPVIIPVTHTKSGDRAHDGSKPLRTITTAKGGELALALPKLSPIVAPHVMKFHEGSVGVSPEVPMPTVTANSPHGRPGGAVPLSVVQTVLAPVILNNMNNNIPWPASDPLATLCTGNHKYLIAPRLSRVSDEMSETLIAGTMVQTGYGENEGQAPRALDVEKPLGTVVAGAAKHAAVCAVLRPSTDASCKGRGQVREFLETYRKQKAKADSAKPRAQKPGRRRKKSAKLRLEDCEIPPFVVVDGVAYEIVDIGMRMLRPDELWRAQGFPEQMDVSDFNQAEQIELCGNAVCPPVAEALVRANYTKPNPKQPQKRRAIGEQLELL